MTCGQAPFLKTYGVNLNDVANFSKHALSHDATRAMIRRILTRSKTAHTHNFLLLTGSLLVYGGSNNKAALRSDSDSKVKWPRTQEVAIGQRQQNVAQLQKRSRGSPLDSDTEIGAERLLEAEDESKDSAWASVTSTFATASSSITAVEWSTIGDSITDYILPEWAKALPGYLTKLQLEMDMAPGSLADEILQESEDIYINPEIAWKANVRIGKELCLEEKAFQLLRKRYTAKALARYLDLSEEEVDPEDVPTIAMCGSGGGLRALVAGTGSYLSAQEAGLFDCVTYTAGVSGSCWLQTLYNSSIGGRKHDKVVEHLKRRIGCHIAYPPTALGLLTTSPTSKYLLSGYIEKLKGDAAAEFGLVDIYGLLLAARLLIPRFDLNVVSSDLKLSNQRAYLEKGTNPLPIYTAVRHEIPLEEKTSEKERAQGVASEKTKEIARKESWFQWFEFTPFEFWCEELDAGIPTWSIGRQFQDGHDIPRESGLSLPELRVPLLMGTLSSKHIVCFAEYVC